MSFVPVPGYDASLLKASTLILPTVSIGNVPQLVSDLLIHTFQLQRIGFLDDDSVASVSGVREDIQEQGSTVPIEVFQSKDHKWTCIQQRSPSLKGKRQQFLDNMTEFASQFQKVVLLTTMDASRRLDSQINSAASFRVHGQEDGEYVKRAATLGVPELERADEEDKKTLSHLPGSGLACQLYKQISSTKTTEITLLIMFALEGDNAQDSIEFANFVNALLQLENNIKSWIPPKSWNFLFGTPFNADLYQ